MDRGFVIGIAGGTGSGKTTVADMICTEVGPENVVKVVQDNYYRDLSHEDFETRARKNFDHPDAIDFELMATHINRLRHGQAIDMPQCDFRHMPDCRKLFGLSHGLRLLSRVFWSWKWMLFFVKWTLKFMSTRTAIFVL